MKKILILVAIVVAFAFLFVAGKTASKERTGVAKNNASVASAFTSDSTHYDFGSISMKDGKVTHMFSLTNGSGKPVVIRKIITSCMCTEAFLVHGEDRKGPFGMQGHGFVPPVNETVSTNDKRMVEVVFDPAAHGPAGVGNIERAVFVEDENGGTAMLTFKALVTP